MLIIDQINKTYKSVTALDAVSAEFEPGVYGILGANGAGKTTLMNIITGNLAPSSGQVLYQGQSIHKLGRAYRAILGYMPQQQSLYTGFSGLRFLWYMAALKALPRKTAKERIDKLLHLVNLQNDAYKQLSHYSGGMKQRILIAQALLNDPAILVLDEPTAGLDPFERIRIRNLISTIARDKIVLLATHVVPDIEYIASRVILMKEGRVLVNDAPGNILSSADGRVVEVVCGESDVPSLVVSCKVSNITRIKEGVLLRIVGDPPPGYKCSPVRPTLEDVYLDVVV